MLQPALADQVPVRPDQIKGDDVVEEIDDGLFCQGALDQRLEACLQGAGDRGRGRRQDGFQLVEQRLQAGCYMLRPVGLSWRQRIERGEYGACYLRCAQAGCRETDRQSASVGIDCHSENAGYRGQMLFDVLSNVASLQFVR